MEFENQTVVVTGGTRGIGRAVSLRFAREGARVFAAYLQDDAAAALLVEEAATLPGTIATVRADVSTADGAARLMDEAARETGAIDVLVNNAGIIRDGYLAMMSDDDWDAVIRGNLYPLFHCCKWGVRKMVARRRGAIVTIASVSAFTGNPGQGNYAASKGGAISLTRVLAREVGPLGIRVNTVAPGLIETEMVAGMKPEAVSAIVKQAALGRVGQPDVIGFVQALGDAKAVGDELHFRVLLLLVGDRGVSPGVVQRHGQRTDVHRVLALAA
ncbi:MAG TPA: SDR family NAD(P)-dependent oxidoreductase, partial [Geobacteraceae bacterium]